VGIASGGVDHRRAEPENESMRIEAANADNSLTNYLMAVVMTSCAWLVVWHFKIPVDPGAKDAIPLAFIPLAFALIGLWYLAKALLDSFRIWRYGTSSLEAEQAAALGHRFTGVLTSSKPFDADASYSVQLACIETLYSAVTKGNRYSQVTRWKNSYDARPISPVGGIRVAFDIPADGAATTSPESGAVQKGVRWVLETRCRGLSQYYSIFRLNVHQVPVKRST
jgi:hypothetical protein